MSAFIPLATTIIFGFFSFLCFYYAFKPFENDHEDYLDDILSHASFFEIIQLFFFLLLKICKKFLPHKIYIIAFRIFCFLIGALFLVPIIIVWLLYFS
ncbi:MAG: hypothetical protein VR72_06740 [Clostridiaceae bacterium BRH_c20a]|nr:MAG: hypothetical protein VR72_06740 [Clostridiaceae bacterium BRH_c20a]